MLSFHGSQKIFIVLEPYDIRVGINTLDALVADKLKVEANVGRFLSSATNGTRG